MITAWRLHPHATSAPAGAPRRNCHAFCTISGATNLGDGPQLIRGSGDAGNLGRRQTALRQRPAVVEDLQTDAGDAEPPRRFYKGREIAVTMHYLGAVADARLATTRGRLCALLLKALDVKSGQTVCDIGCGNGFYTLQLAELVGPTGRVLAVDIQNEMLRLLADRAKEAQLANIESILGTPTDPRLPAGSVDLILLVDVYHEFSDPEPMLKSLRRVLKPDGRIALAEFRLEDRNVPIKLLHKMSKKQILKEFPPNGLKLVGQFEKLPWQHLMFFGPDAAP